MVTNPFLRDGRGGLPSRWFGHCLLPLGGDGGEVSATTKNPKPPNFGFFNHFSCRDRHKDIWLPYFRVRVDPRKHDRLAFASVFIE